MKRKADIGDDELVFTKADVHPFIMANSKVIAKAVGDQAAKEAELRRLLIDAIKEMDRRVKKLEGK